MEEVVPGGFLSHLDMKGESCYTNPYLMKPFLEDILSQLRRKQLSWLLSCHCDKTPWPEETRRKEECLCAQRSVGRRPLMAEATS